MEITNYIFISLVSVKTHLMLGHFSKKLFNHFLIFKHIPKDNKMPCKEKNVFLLWKVITYIYSYLFGYGIYSLY